MTVSDIVKAVQSLSKKDCVTVGNACRRRVQALARSPDPMSALLLRKSRTASLSINGTEATGEIIDRSATVVTLRFSDRTTLVCQVADLLPTGFDRPVTPFPDSGVPPEFTTDAAAPLNLHEYAGALYHIEKTSGTLAEGRRVRLGAVEPLQAALLRRPMPEIGL